MIDININEILITLVSSGITGFTTWFFTRKKYDAEVESQKLDNEDKANQIYQKLLDDVNQRLNESLERNRKLETEVSELRKQVFDLTMNICLDLSCAHRLKEIKKNRKTSEKPKE